MTQRIELTAGAAYQRFFAELSGRLITFEIRWMTNYGFFAVDIYEGDEAITLGRGLNPGTNLVAGLNTGLGAIHLEGNAPTIGNLGVSNRLLYEEDEADA